MQHKSHHPQEVQEAVLTKAVVRAADAWGLSNQQLSQMLGVRECDVLQLKLGRYGLCLNSPSWERALLFLCAFRGLDAYMGGHLEQEKSWLRAYNHALGGVPCALMCQAAGLLAVVRYLDAILGHE